MGTFITATEDWNLAHNIIIVYRPSLLLSNITVMILNHRFTVLL